MEKVRHYRSQNHSGNTQQQDSNNSRTVGGLLFLEPDLNSSGNMSITGSDGMLRLVGDPTGGSAGVKNIRSIRNSSGAKMSGGSITLPKGSPVGVMAELGGLSGAYAFSNPNGSAMLIIRSRMLAVTTDGADSAVIDNINNAVSIACHTGDFRITVITADRRTAVVSGNANGDVEISRSGSNATVKTLGSYVVEYVEDGKLPQELVQVRQPAFAAAATSSLPPANHSTRAEYRGGRAKALFVG